MIRKYKIYNIKLNKFIGKKTTNKKLNTGDFISYKQDNMIKELKKTIGLFKVEQRLGKVLFCNPISFETMKVDIETQLKSIKDKEVKNEG